jgi:hypothetical protein
MTPLRLLCVHGIGHHEADPTLTPQWTNAIQRGLLTWNPGRPIEIKFVPYDDLFAVAPLSAADVAAAFAKLAASGIFHGVGDLFRARGLFDIPDRLRWTAGMVVQWANDEKLRRATRKRVLDLVEQFNPEVVLAHSLGSLISYDAFVRPENQKALAHRVLVTFGSQIGNPFVRSTLGGRIKELTQPRRWFHLFNEHDDAFTSRLRLSSLSFSEVNTEFDLEGILDHDAVGYLTHANTVATVWPEVAGGGRARSFERQVTPVKRAIRRPQKRALLVGINDYPNPANRLEGCVNDVFLMSSVLQESGFPADEIRVVLNERATSSAVLERLEWLLEGANDESDRVFFYSGHGAQIPGYGSNEVIDHEDECLVTHDFNWSRQTAVTDEQFYELYSQLPYEARFLAILDCCHSGGMTREGGSRVRGLNPPDDIRHRMLWWDAKNEMWRPRDTDEVNKDTGRWVKKTDFDKKAVAGERGNVRRIGRAVQLRSLPDAAYDRTRKELGHYGPYLPVILEACGEREFSYEYRHGVQSYGAFTYTLAGVLRAQRAARRKVTWQKLVELTTAKLHALKYKQKPVLVCPDHLRTTNVPYGSAKTK